MLSLLILCISVESWVFCLGPLSSMHSLCYPALEEFLLEVEVDIHPLALRQAETLQILRKALLLA